MEDRSIVDENLAANATVNVVDILKNEEEVNGLQSIFFILNFLLSFP